MVEVSRVFIALFVISLYISSASANDSPYSLINREGSSEIIDSVTVNICEELVLSGQYSYDLDGKVEVFAWFDGDKLLSEEVFLVMRITDTTTKNIRLEVTDNEGKTDESTVLVYSHSTPEPRIDSMINSMADDDIYQTDEFEIVVTVYGDKSQKLDFIWNYDEKIVEKIKESERIRGDNTEYRAIFVARTSGNSKISFSVTNLCGKTAVKGVDVSILSSQTPKIREIIIMEGDIREDEWFEISAEVSNCEGGCEYYWEIFNIGYLKELTVDSSNRETIAPRLKDEGLYEVNLTVTNKAGISVYKTDTFEVPNTKNDPPIADASATGKVAILDEVFQLNGSKSYDDGEDLTHHWFLKNGATNKYEEICLESIKKSVCYVNFSRTRKMDLRYVVGDSASPSLKSEPTYFSVEVVASKEDAMNEEETITGGTEGTASAQQVYQPLSYRNSQIINEEELERTINEMPGFEFLVTFLAIIIMARTSGRKGL